MNRNSASSLVYQNDESEENVNRKHLVFGKCKPTVFSAVLLALVIFPKHSGNFRFV
jgi:hypothetical protein